MQFHHARENCGSDFDSRMAVRCLVSSVVERMTWINEFPSVPVYVLATPQPRERAAPPHLHSRAAAPHHPLPMERRLATGGQDQVPTFLWRRLRWLQLSAIFNTSVEQSRLSCHPSQLSLTRQGCCLHVRETFQQVWARCVALPLIPVLLVACCGALFSWRGAVRHSRDDSSLPSLSGSQCVCPSRALAHCVSS